MANQSETRSVSGKSIAAFFLLPQFWRSFEHFSDIGPIFVRTLAIMFEQAELIAKNHPGTMYGAPGVPKVRIRDLLGEAWFTLRTKQNATPYQWGMFASVVMMITTIIASIGTLAIQFMAGLTAHAPTHWLLLYRPPRLIPCLTQPRLRQILRLICLTGF